MRPATEQRFLARPGHAGPASESGVGGGMEIVVQGQIHGIQKCLPRARSSQIVRVNSQPDHAPAPCGPASTEHHRPTPPRLSEFAGPECVYPRPIKRAVVQRPHGHRVRAHLKPVPAQRGHRARRGEPARRDEGVRPQAELIYRGACREKPQASLMRWKRGEFRTSQCTSRLLRTRREARQETLGGVHRVIKTVQRERVTDRESFPDPS